MSRFHEREVEEEEEEEEEKEDGEEAEDKEEEGRPLHATLKKVKACCACDPCGRRPPEGEFKSTQPSPASALVIRVLGSLRVHPSTHSPPGHRQQLHRQLMAEQQTISAPFPTPPPFYKHFTKQNLARLRQLRKEAGITSESTTTTTTTDDDTPKRDLDLLSLPPELRYLLPPAPPPDGKFSVFGDTIDLVAPEATLADGGIEQLYPADASVRLNPQPHLIGLARSLLTTFLGLTGILSQNPELYEERVTDLQTIMYNLHDLINQYRPHQARESLIFMMEERVEGMKEEIRRIEEGKERVAKLLQGLSDQDMVGVKGEDKKVEQKDERGPKGVGVDALKRQARQRSAWEALENELG
jgi:mediator of RNA polymerase II transcription subunit 7